MKREKFEHWNFQNLSGLISMYSARENLHIDFCIIKFNEDILMYEADVIFTSK